MAKIRIKDLCELECERGRTLLEVLHQNRIFIENPCNGKGTCGKCLVKVLSGYVSPMSETEKQRMKPEEIVAGHRLSCMTSVIGDCEIALLQRERKHSVLTSGYMPAFEKDDLDGYGVAVDIGTTTVALTLQHLHIGRGLSRYSLASL